MAKPLHAVDYFTQAEKHPPRPVCVLSGDDEFLKRQALLRLRRAVLGDGEGEADFSFTAFEGGRAELRDVLDELSTMAMFGGDKRLVVVREADEFVTRYRGELEDYVAKPRTGGILVLVVKSWPATTRLAKAVAKTGLHVDCNCPPSARLPRWLSAWAKREHNVQLSQACGEMLVEMVGTELGLLDQELAKLALAAGPGGKISADDLTQMVGSWRAKTTWAMLDAVLAGDVRGSLVELDRLLLAGESPVALLGQMASSLRRFAAATRLILQAEAAGQRVSLREALGQAGVKPFVLARAETQLRRLGRRRGGKLYRWLLDADLDLKGASAVPPRLIIERLFLRLAAAEAR